MLKQYAPWVLLMVKPISIIAPCHRVIGSGKLVGFAGGLDKKKFC